MSDQHDTMNKSDSFDVVIIGSGPGGYVAAIKAAQLGMKVALIEKYGTLGGTCLNVGCIPSKALLDSSERYFEASHKFKDHGVVCESVSFDFDIMQKRKTDVVKTITQGVRFLMKSNKVTCFEGVGQFVDPYTVRVTSGEDGGKKTDVNGKNIIIATGSKPAGLRGVDLDKKRVISSTEALSLSKIPRSMVVIGAGAIGLEMASIYARLGTQVSVVEYLDTAVPMMDRDLGRELTRVMKKELGIAFYFNTAIQKVDCAFEAVKVTGNFKEGENLQIEADYCLVSVGRRPYHEGVGLDVVGASVDERGRIEVDDSLRVKTAKGFSHIYAIGDVIAGPMLAHKAEEEGIFVAELLAGHQPKPSHISHTLIPSVVYTWPEVASVGLTEDQLKMEGASYSVGKFPFRASGRARAAGEIDGLIKVLADTKSGRVLGVHMMGPRVADMIAEAVIAMAHEITAHDIAAASHPHPTFSESFKEACMMAATGRAIHV